MQDRCSGPRHAFQLEDRARPQPLQHRQAQTTDGRGHMRERVRPLVPIRRRVGQRAGAAASATTTNAPAHGVFAGVGLRSFSERVIGPKVCSSTRANSLGGANASITTSTPRP